uniref:Uncharacterized protein n=1 Tax=Anguilla anguilla TaxID=7936 RepID=A0A0E9SXN6_ANGAN
MHVSLYAGTMKIIFICFCMCVSVCVDMHVLMCVCMHVQ